jgi:CubicO group peptidase (beta-lactamase class C family)
MRLICSAVLLWASLIAFPYAQAPTGIWEGKMESGPGASWRVDFDNRVWSLNGGPPVPLTMVPSDDPATVQFDVSFGGNVLRYIGKRDESRIVGTIAKINLSLTRLPDGTPALAVRKRAPFPGSGPRDAAAITKARALVAELVRSQEIPGLSIAVARKGTIVWSEGFGLADVESGVPVTPLTRFRAGSVSKVLTAAGVAKLVEEGKLDLDAPVQRYVPGFPTKPWPITTRQLAAHTAGVRHYNDADQAVTKGAPHFSSVADGLALFQGDPLLFQPGTSYSYSSHGWSLVSAVVEGASGQEFLSFMSARVFEPLGLRSIVPDHVDVLVPGRTRFYAREAPGRPLEHAPQVDLSYVWAAGGYLATADDLVRFGSAHLQPGFFTQGTLDLLFRRVSVIPQSKTSVGIGWRIGTDAQGRRILHHAGASVGGRAVLLVFPDSGVVVALLSNTLAGFGEGDAGRIGALFIPN